VRRDEELKREMAYVADHVTYPDTPGTELAAYFDRLHPDDLLSVVEYLRTPFKPGNSLYIDHAQQALKRKRNFPEWMFAQHPEFTGPGAPALLDESEWELSPSERDDKSESSYPFKFNAAWFEVKAAMPTVTVIRNDLFLEEDLAQTLKLQNDSALLDPETDSPVIEVQPPSAFEARFASSPSASDKGVFDEPDDLPDADCLEFEAAVTKLIAVKDLDPDQILTVLKTEKTTGRNRYYDLLKGVVSKYSFLRGLYHFSV
jgi:hypothetical protein